MQGSRELDPNHDQFENLRNYVSKFEEHMPKAQEVARACASHVCTRVSGSPQRLRRSHGGFVG